MSKKLIVAFSLFLASCGTGQSPNPIVPDQPDQGQTETETGNNTGTETTVPENAKTLYVDSQLATCTGVGPMQCMRVRSDVNKDWTFFYSQIEGFDYEPGYAYELLVTESKIENPPADSSSIKTTLVKVVKKEAVASTGLANTQWVYEAMNVDGTSTPVIANSEITLSFTDNRVSGSAGCNNFMGEYSQTDAQLAFKPLASTKRACLDEALNQQEQSFLSHLGKASQWSINQDILTLTDAAGTSLRFKAQAE